MTENIESSSSNVSSSLNNAIVMETSNLSLNKPLKKKTMDTKENLSTSHSEVRQRKLLLSLLLKYIIILSM